MFSTSHPRQTSRLALILVLALPAPRGGRSPQRRSDDPPVVTSFRLQGGASSVLPGTAMRLDHVVTGRLPTSYRVSSTSDFHDAAWQRYEHLPKWTPANPQLITGGTCGARGATLVAYFQVRAPAAGLKAEGVRGHTDGQGNVLSNVAADTICVHG
jgi:hypothetical protein